MCWGRKEFWSLLVNVFFRILMVTLWVFASGPHLKGKALASISMQKPVGLCPKDQPGESNRRQFDEFLNKSVKQAPSPIFQEGSCYNYEALLQKVKLTPRQLLPSVNIESKRVTRKRVLILRVPLN